MADHLFDVFVHQELLQMRVDLSAYKSETLPRINVKKPGCVNEVRVFEAIRGSVVVYGLTVQQVLCFSVPYKLPSHVFSLVG